MITLLKISQVDDTWRDVELAEELYESLMPAIRKQMIADGYEYYNVDCISTEPYVYRYHYCKVR